ncbi:MAG TPA: hypothetical protein VH092_31840 [Urbifossiella sp.]|jgi:hypothetical protein|nr:hypothetical protein [Urbifossiella sp.]
MTDAEWWTGAEVAGMLLFLSQMEPPPGPGISSGRFHTFAAACAARVDPLLSDEVRRIVDRLREPPARDPSPEWQIYWREFAELSEATEPVQVTTAAGDYRAVCAAAVRRSATLAAGQWMLGRPYHTARNVAWQAARAVELADRLASYPVGTPVPSDVLAFGNEPVSTAERVAQADLVRCVFGNPFHPVAVDPGWRTEAVVSLARGMDATRDFAAMPVLADALEDILAHARGPGPHARGCHVLDRVLGRW